MHLSPCITLATDRRPDNTNSSYFGHFLELSASKSVLLQSITIASNSECTTTIFVTNGPWRPVQNEQSAWRQVCELDATEAVVRCELKEPGQSTLGVRVEAGQTLGIWITTEDSCGVGYGEDCDSVPQIQDQHITVTPGEYQNRRGRWSRNTNGTTREFLGEFEYCPLISGPVQVS